jgi:hypothetical protein
MCTKQFSRPLARANTYRKLNRDRSKLKLANPQTRKIRVPAVKQVLMLRNEADYSIILSQLDARKLFVDFSINM